MRQSAEPVEIKAIVEHETERAWKIFDGDRMAWLPKSQGAVTALCVSGVYTFAVPEWLAIEKELV